MQKSAFFLRIMFTGVMSAVFLAAAAIFSVATKAYAGDLFTTFNLFINNTHYKYYYEGLSDREKEIYNTFANNLDALLRGNAFELNIKAPSLEEEKTALMQTVINAVKCFKADYPELYFIETDQIRLMYSGTVTRVAAKTSSGYFAGDTSRLNTINENAAISDKVEDEIAFSEQPLIKEVLDADGKIIYNYLDQNTPDYYTMYNLTVSAKTAVKKVYDNLINNRKTDEGRDIYDGIVLGNYNAETMAASFKLVMDYLQIPSITVIGKLNGKTSAYNYVSLQGEWFLVDCFYNQFLLNADDASEYENVGHIGDYYFVYPRLSSKNSDFFDNLDFNVTEKTEREEGIITTANILFEQHYDVLKYTVNYKISSANFDAANQTYIAKQTVLDGSKALYSLYYIVLGDNPRFLNNRVGGLTQYSFAIVNMPASQLYLINNQSEASELFQLQDKSIKGTVIGYEGPVYDDAGRLVGIAGDFTKFMEEAGAELLTGFTVSNTCVNMGVDVEVAYADTKLSKPSLKEDIGFGLKNMRIVYTRDLLPIANVEFRFDIKAYNGKMYDAKAYIPDIQTDVSDLKIEGGKTVSFTFMPDARYDNVYYVFNLIGYISKYESAAVNSFIYFVNGSQNHGFEYSVLPGETGLVGYTINSGLKVASSETTVYNLTDSHLVVSRYKNEDMLNLLKLGSYEYQEMYEITLQSQNGVNLNSADLQLLFPNTGNSMNYSYLCVFFEPGTSGFQTKTMNAVKGGLLLDNCKNGIYAIFKQEREKEEFNINIQSYSQVKADMTLSAVPGDRVYISFYNLSYGYYIKDVLVWSSATGSYIEVIEQTENKIYYYQMPDTSVYVKFEIELKAMANSTGDTSAVYVLKELDQQDVAITFALTSIVLIVIIGAVVRKQRRI